MSQVHVTIPQTSKTLFSQRELWGTHKNYFILKGYKQLFQINFPIINIIHAYITHAFILEKRMHRFQHPKENKYSRKNGKAFPDFMTEIHVYYVACMLQSSGWAYPTLYVFIHPLPHPYSIWWTKLQRTEMDLQLILKFYLFRCIAGNLSHVYKPYMHTVLFVLENHDLSSE